uniref:DC1 domain-containing protein n=1 Tax=Oryza glumipatula TaxID=40148 RepID=A0A0E0AUZ9_9ORYZ
MDVVAQECTGYNSKLILSHSIQENQIVPHKRCNYIFKMEPLNYNASRDLLASRAFGHQQVAPELNGVLSEIARKCGGLPQAIIGAANLLANRPVNIDVKQKSAIDRWNNYVQNSLIPDLRTNHTSDGMAQLLSNIFENLPSHLKACMLYLSIYKEDYIIKKDDLVKQWMAEGFVCAIVGKDMEEVARSCFHELVHRGMIEPVDIGYNDEIVSCTLHHMVSNLIRHKAMEENFVTALDQSQTGIRLADKVRRLSLHFGNSEDAKPPENIRLTHGEDDKVFNLTNISELFRLRSLQIQCNGRVKLPSELSGLKYLETLQIDSRVASVPSDIFHLPQLLHLRLPPSLQHFGDSRNEQSNNTDKKRLANHQLQDLQLICFPVTSDYLERNMKVLGLILQLFDSLKSLTVVPSHFPTYNSVHGASRNAISCDDIEFVVSSSPSLLQRLELYPRVCVFSTLPSWIRNLEKLSILKISVIQLGVEDIKTLSLLGALTALSLYVRTTSSESIIIDESGFRVLKYFKFNCSTISSLSFKNGAMPNLQKLKMGFNDSKVEQCNLANVGFEHLSTIKEIIIKIRVIDESGRIAINRSTLRDSIRRNISTSTNVIVRLTDREFYEIMLSNKNFKDLPAEIAHQFHPAHKLRLAVGTETNWPSRCGGCEEPGAGRRYTCEPCNLTLYMCCATAPHALEHPLFPGLAFRLREKPPPVAECGRACDACGDLLDEDGFVYHSSDPAAGAERGLDLHPRCARLPARAVSARRYAFELRKKVASRGRCGICMYRHRFWSYRFYYDDEAVYLHIACLKDLASQSHETLTKLYDILMDGMQWMPTNNWVTTERSVDGSSEKDRSRVLPEEQDEITEEFQYFRSQIVLTSDCVKSFEHKGNLAMTIMEEFVQTPETITHRSHPQHKLRLVTTTCDAPFECDGCEEPGEGPRYCCRTDGCKFDLHKFCAQAPRKLHHDLFQGRTFVFLDRPPPGPSPPRPDGPRRCDTCGDPVRGWCYHCPGANIDLHPCCASLQGAAITLDGLAFDIGAPSRCSLCRTDKGGGRRHREQWCYHTDIDGEGVYLHVACVKHLARRRWLAGREKKYGGQIMLASEELMKEGPLKSISSEQARKIVGAAVRIIITVIFGDPTAIVGDVDTWVPLPLRWLADLFSIQS